MLKVILILLSISLHLSADAELEYLKKNAFKYQEDESTPQKSPKVTQEPLKQESNIQENVEFDELDSKYFKSL